jgi:hypothetical protein
MVFFLCKHMLRQHLTLGHFYFIHILRNLSFSYLPTILQCIAQYWKNLQINKYVNKYFPQLNVDPLSSTEILNSDLTVCNKIFFSVLKTHVFNFNSSNGQLFQPHFQNVFRLSSWLISHMAVFIYLWHSLCIHLIQQDLFKALPN